MQAEEPKLIQHRNKAQDAAVIFIHGFGGNAGQETWGNFQDYLKKERDLANWDIYCLSYATKLRIDLVGIWAADPDIPKLARYLHTCCKTPPLDRYKCLALVAHSMGGLVVQRALVDFDDLSDVVSHLFLFGTPSGGLQKASPFRWLKRQGRDMTSKSPFIIDLRHRWLQKFGDSFGKTLPFRFWIVAGDRDEFVPASSSLAPFQNDFSKAEIDVVPGNHLQIVKPCSDKELSVQLLFKGLRGNAGVSGSWTGAAVAVESRDFKKAIKLLEPHLDELDVDAVVQLALALESVGRSEDALSLLEKHQHSSTDAMGVLAGRLKRRWLVERRDADARRARELYAEAYRLAEEAVDHEQAFYHGINIAFMDLAYGTNRTEAKAKAAGMAARVLQHCQQTEPGKWRYATEAEASLMLGERSDAMEHYHAYLNASPAPREIESTYLQAKKVAYLMASRETARQLDLLFLGNEEQEIQQ